MVVRSPELRRHAVKLVIYEHTDDGATVETQGCWRLPTSR